MAKKRSRKKKKRAQGKTDEEQELNRMLDRAHKSVARKHHLVPEFYLSRWAAEGQLRVTEATSRHTYLTTPSKAAIETDFYRIDAEEVNPKEVPPLLFETLLSDIEGNAAEAI